MEKNSNLHVIILAAGKGTRMKSSLPKALQKLGGFSFLHHLIITALKITPNITVVISEDELLEKELSKFPSVQKVYQKQRLGTAHAVLTAKDNLKNFKGKVIVLYVDVPLISVETLVSLTENKNSLTVLGFESKNPFGYGRLIIKNNSLLKIVEEKDSSAAQKKVNICNSGIMCFENSTMWQILEKISNNNASKEYYLTDSVEIANSLKLKTGVQLALEDEVKGVNSKLELANLESTLQTKLRNQHMENGVNLISPENTFFCLDTQIQADTSIEPFVVFGKNVKIGKNCTVKSFSHLEGVEIQDACEVGPFARIRPNSVLKSGSKIGNFVEVKNANFEQGVKASHLSYLGDIEIGQNTNIGAGTIVCNYDGKNKYKTKIGKDVFVGSNSSLISPLEIGDGAIIGAGTVVTKNVAKKTKVYNKIQPIIK